MKEYSDLPSGTHKTLIAPNPSPVTKRFVLPGSPLVPVLTGKELADPYLWPRSVVETLDSRSIRAIQASEAGKYARENPGSVNKKKVQDMITAAKKIRDDRNERYRADLRKTLEMRIDGVRQLVVEYISLLMVEDKSGDL